MMKILCNVLACGVLSGMSAFAAEVHEFNISKGGVALHNNQIFIRQNEEWVSVGGIGSDGRFYMSKGLPPCMSRCSRIDVEWDYENGRLIVSGRRLPEDRDEDKKSENKHNAEARDSSESSDRTEQHLRE
jgi:hypothetical protein